MSTPTTREQVLHELQGIRRAVRQGVDAPHKPLMLLLGHARELIGTVDPVDALLRWKAPSERR